MLLDKEKIDEIESAIRYDNDHLEPSNINLVKKRNGELIVIKSLNYMNAQFYVFVRIGKEIWLYGVARRLDDNGWWVYSWADFNAEDFEELMSSN